MSKTQLIKVRMTESDYQDILDNLEYDQNVSQFVRKAIRHYVKEVLNNGTN